MNNPNHKTASERLRKVRSVVPPVPKRFKRVKGEDRIHAAFQNIPNITNETVAEHREGVLKGARKYKYPLQHSKHRIVIISTALSITAIIGFFVYAGLALYKFQSSNSFMYRVTQVLPVPVAKAGSSYVSYENYLFELRRYQHYYHTQQRVDFDSQSGKDQLASYKPKALDTVVRAAYVKQLAAQNKVSVSTSDLNAEFDSLRAQNQSSDQELAAVTSKFFGWSLDDLRREVKQELLEQKVAAKLDTGALAKANNLLAQIRSGTDFATLATQESQAPDKAAGGQYANTAITLASTDIPTAVSRELSKMQVGQVSGVLMAGNSYEIVKLLENTDGKLKAAHISVQINSLDATLKAYQQKHPLHTYIKVE